jgi:hypothetical protein
MLANDAPSENWKKYHWSWYCVKDIHDSSGIPNRLGRYVELYWLVPVVTK